jgi:hypothetical protein
MNSGKIKPLSGGPPIGGTLESKIIIVLLAVVVVLGAAAFALYSTTQSQERALDARQAEFEAMTLNLSQLSGDYAALNANYTRLAGDFAAVRGNYENVSAEYAALQNRTSTVDSRLSTFLENVPTVGYTYSIAPKLLPDNTTDQVLTVTAYNLGKLDIGSLKITCTVKEGNVTNVYNKTFTYVSSLDKRQARWEFDNATEVLGVWAGVA